MAPAQRLLCWGQNLCRVAVLCTGQSEWLALPGSWWLLPGWSCLFCPAAPALPGHRDQSVQGAEVLPTAPSPAGSSPGQLCGCPCPQQELHWGELGGPSQPRLFHGSVYGLCENWKYTLNLQLKESLIPFQKVKFAGFWSPEWLCLHSRGEAVDLNQFLQEWIAQHL